MENFDIFMELLWDLNYVGAIVKNEFFHVSCKMLFMLFSEFCLKNYILLNESFQYTVKTTDFLRDHKNTEQIS